MTLTPKGVTSAKCVSASNENNRSKAHGPKSTTLQKLEVSKDVTFRVRKCGLSDSWKIIRFLFSKAALEPEELTLEDVLIADSMLERMLRSREYSWNKKYRKTLLPVSDCFKLLQFTQEGLPSSSNGLSNFLNAFVPEFLMSANAYFGRKKSFLAHKLIVRHNRRLNATPRPQAYIGVGYRDHGTCSIPHFDGSPAWQAVASAVVKDSRTKPELLEYDKHLTTFSLFERKQVPRAHPW